MLGGSISTARVRIGLANKFYVNFVPKKHVICEEKCYR